DFRRGPNIELPFDSFAVGVLSAKEWSLRTGHLAEYVIQRFFGHFSIEAITGRLERFQIGQGEKRIIVKHFFEVRHEPTFVSAVAMKTSAEVIVHTAPGHPVERQSSHVQ